MEFGEPRRLRGFIKTGVACALSLIRADALIGRLVDLRATPLVLGYHRVVESFASESRRAIPAMLTSRAMLERQLDWIGRRFRFVSLDELGRRLEEDGDGHGLAAVTFDDGYRDVYEQAFPLLIRKGIPAAVFVVSDLIGTAELQVHDRLHVLLTRAMRRLPDPARALRVLLLELGIGLRDTERLDALVGNPLLTTVWLLRGLARTDVDLLMDALQDRLKIEAEDTRGMLPLTWEMLASMQRAGVTVGSHTRRHAWLTQEEPDTVVDELRASRRQIEERLGLAVHHFAYPDGRFTGATADAVACAGYRFGYTTCMHRDPRHPMLTIPRRMLWQNSCLDALGRFSPAIMSCQVHGVFGLVHGCEQHHAA